MKIEILGVMLSIWYFVKKWTNEISKVIEPIVKEVEKLAIDGLIDKRDRKELVMKIIRVMEEKKIIKFNFFTRQILNYVVNRIAQKLPDFKVVTDLKKINFEEKLNEVPKMV